MQLIKYIIIYIVLLFVENNLLHLIAIKKVTPDLILIFVIIISLKETKSTATLIGFFSGLIQDVFTTSFFGLSAMTKSIIGFWGVFFQQPTKRYSLTSYIVAVTVLVLVHETVYGFIYNLGSHIGFFRLLFQFVIPRSLYTLFIALTVYLIFKPIFWRSEYISR